MAGIVCLLAIFAHAEKTALVAGVVAGIAAVLALACVPGLIARQKMHPQAGAVELLGFLGMFIGIAWIVALIWAVALSDLSASRRHSGHRMAR